MESRRGSLIRTFRVTWLSLVGIGFAVGWLTSRTSGAAVDVSDYPEGFTVESAELARDSTGEPIWDAVPFVSPPAEVPPETTANVHALADEQARTEAGYIPDLEELAFPDLPPDPQ